jgi:XTP/dITP diphosphohydrolase
VPLPKRIVFASGNCGKLAEVERLLANYDVEVVAQSELGITGADETATTFSGNSLLKSRHAAAESGLPAIADDSGLVVDALDGAPGVYSARYAGVDADDDANIDKLLAALDGVPRDARAAAFHCVASFVDPAIDEPLFAEGRWSGLILEARRGNGGFGYDPVFFDPAVGKSAAEFAADEKNRVSHRGQALRTLIARIEERYGRS